LDILNNIGINPIFLLAQILNFAVLALLLRALLYKPILKMLDERRAKIEKGLEDARAAEQARQGAEAERARLLDEARAEAQKLRAEANQQAEQAAAKIKADAQAEAEKIKADALAGLTGERDKMLSELRGQIAALAMAAAHKVVGATLDEQRQRALITDFFAKVPAEVRSGLSGVAGKAIVTSALPLTDAEQSAVRRDLSLVEVEFKVDPAILGGLVVRVGDRVVDGSVAGRLESLRASLG
jgi:F-type H+-transporting ATPase subunit b